MGREAGSIPVADSFTKQRIEILVTTRKQRRVTYFRKRTQRHTPLRKTAASVLPIVCFSVVKTAEGASRPETCVPQSVPNASVLSVPRSL